MVGRPISLLKLKPQTRSELESCAQGNSSHLALRARIILLRTRLPQADTAKKLGISKRSVSKWTVRYEEAGMAGLRDKGGRGRKRKMPSEEPPRFKSLSQKKKKRVDQKPIQKEEEQKHTAETIPSMRMVSDEANVSLMTVSRVLRNQPHVNPELRERVLKVATKLGYRTDPGISKLMVHLRKRKTVGLQGTICSLEAESWDDSINAYFSPMVKAARKHAESLGFTWERFSFERFMERPEHSLRVLYHRGVDGILLLPLPPEMQQCALPDSVLWNHFSVMVATYAIDSPAFSRVVPDHFKNIKLICEKLRGLGCHQIGMAIPKQFDDRVLHHYSGGYAAFHLSQNETMLRPFMYQSMEERWERISSWYQAEKPDAIIAGSCEAAREIARDLKLSQTRKVHFATISLPDETLNGIDELPERIGSVAVQLLSGMVARNEKGIPERPMATMVPGKWKSAKAS